MQLVLGQDQQLSDDEVAAALAAVQAVLSLEQRAPAAPEPISSGWRNSGRLAVQKLQPAKTSVVPRWQTIERLRKTIGGRYDARSF